MRCGREASLSSRCIVVILAPDGACKVGGANPLKNPLHKQAFDSPADADAVEKITCVYSYKGSTVNE